MVTSLVIKDRYQDLIGSDMMWIRYHHKPTVGKTMSQCKPSLKCLLFIVTFTVTSSHLHHKKLSKFMQSDQQNTPFIAVRLVTAMF